MTDEAIVGLFWERDERAIEESKTQYDRYLTAVAVNIVGNREDADECVNDTLLAAWDAIPPHKPKNLKTFLGKLARRIAIDAFRRGQDLVYVHVEAPDECGHRAEIENKVLSIEKIDSLILAPVVEYLRSTGENFHVMCLPDHPTPIEIRTHSMEPVPFFIYRSEAEREGVASLTEDTAEVCRNYIPDGTALMDMLINA